MTVRYGPRRDGGEPSAAARPRRGQLVTVVAARGGRGRTTTATNLAVHLAAGGTRSVCLVDLDLAFGDVAIALRLDPARTLADALADHPDEAGLRRLLTPYRPGVETLLAPVGPTAGERVSPRLVGALLDLARRHFDHVVVDTPPFLTDQVLAALDVTDRYLLLATPDLPSLANLRLTLDLFDLRGYPAAARLVVLNRADEPTGLALTDVARVIGVPIRARVPSSGDVPISLDRGVPLAVEAPGHPVSRAIRDFAEEFLLAGPAAAPARGLGRLRHLGRRAVPR